MTPLQLILAGGFLFACGFVWGQRAEWFRSLWCDLTHGGGDIKRDSLGRINWQCRDCGRWSRYPVELDEEARLFSNSYKFDEDTHS